MVETIKNISLYCLQTIYTMLPAIGANVAPILMKKVPFLNYPMDFNKSIGGKRILGDHKTFRGLFFGVVFAFVIVNIQYMAANLSNTWWVLYEPNYITAILIGISMGVGTILGDAVKSFFKRRLDIKPGQPFIPWDQIDCALGGLILGRIFWAYPLKFAIATLVMTFCLHIIIRHIAAAFGLCEKW